MRAPRGHEQDCEELTRVWKALDIAWPNGMSASENVAALQAKLDAAELRAAGAETMHSALKRIAVAVGHTPTLLDGDQPLASVVLMVGKLKAVVEALGAAMSRIYCCNTGEESASGRLIVASGNRECGCWGCDSYDELRTALDAVKGER